ncbi:hypothetical protein CQA53_03755 [Helicobacter didelphidarum]|uniref:UDP-glucose 6-dehydrogenase n=1 Tax=Helicobacter didelphidarum TaxID=2040648 RepID=A0A3D8IM90_9HELI|nr:polysaccharide deacetylase family protein [Helicobacter didelphidarum]RDU66348.1 hypothetical protein CQA53_03755 [Helicobacter didelphidarum]
MKIAIIGFGYVGRAFYSFFKTYGYYEVSVFDNDEKVLKEFDYVSSKLEDVNLSDLIVICVPTPANSDGSVNTNIVDEVLSVIGSEKLVLIKSTIPPNITDKFSKKYPYLHIVFSPEYIGESKYFLPLPYDFNKEVIKTPYFIFGGDCRDTDKIVKIFSKIAGPTKEYIQTSSLNAELCKYMENSFFATKIIFCNEFYKICESFGANYSQVRELWLKDVRINKMHTMIYDNEDTLCFSGKCLPKDLSGIIQHTIKQGYQPEFLQKVQECNNEIHKLNILMIHRVHIHANQLINPLYFERGLVVSIFKIEQIINSFLERGMSFGSLEQCLSNPNKYFCLTFDDGFKEHIEVAKRISKKYNATQESLIFCINVGNLAYNICNAMDIVYYMAYHSQIELLFEYMNIKNLNNDMINNILLIKQYLLKQSPEFFKSLTQAFSCDEIQNNYLNIRDIQEISQIATIASHGITHRDLRFHQDLSTEEILESKDILEEMLNKEITIFCYPEGKNDAFLQESCKELGFQYALSIQHSKKNNYSVGRRYC